MKKQTIAIHIGESETMQVDAYLHPVEGLAVHRQVAYVPAKQEHKFTSKWQLTHIHTGKALLKPSECLDTMALAVALGRKLDSVDWTHDVSRSAGDLVSRALSEGVEAEEEEAPTPKRYTIRRGAEGGYVVWDSLTDGMVEKFPHRGMASEKARELNAATSL